MPMLFYIDIKFQANVILVIRIGKKEAFWPTSHRWKAKLKKPTEVGLRVSPPEIIKATWTKTRDLHDNSIPGRDIGFVKREN